MTVIVISNAQIGRENFKKVKAYVDANPKPTIIECCKATGLVHSVVDRHMKFLKAISLEN